MKPRAFRAGHFLDDPILWHDAALLRGFGQPPYQPTASEDAVSATMGSYWTNFARTSDPNGPGVASWPHYVAASERILALDEPIGGVDTATSAPSGTPFPSSSRRRHPRPPQDDQPFRGALSRLPRMLPTVQVPPRRVDDLRPAAGDEAVDRLREAAAALAGARILQVNSTSYGGGVAELLFTQIALLNDLGLETTWQLIEGDTAFFTITKHAHNGLQGAEVPWTQEMVDTYLARCRSNAAGLAEGYDFVIIHDPQPAGILTILEEEGKRKGTWLWRCHIDLSAPFPPVWESLATHVQRHDGAVFTMPDFVKPELHLPVFTIPPSIDPLSAKNAPLEGGVIRGVLARYGVDGARPIVTQVSRFDPWKDPLGVIDAYRIAKEKVPDLQLVMVASMADDDPEGQHYLDLTQSYRAGDPDVFLLSNLDGVGNREVNAFQRASAVVVQKSIREGFGLVVAEAMWKERPVVGGDVGGIRLQIEDGRSGFLVDSAEACGARILELLSDQAERERMGRAGRERVRERFLTPRELEDSLRALASLA